MILGSHACRAGMLLLEHKGIRYRTVRLPSGVQWYAMRAMGFPRKTVPGLRIDGRRVQTNPAIARFLDELQPEPPLFPADPELRREVEEAERFADEELQMTARRLALAGCLPGADTLIDRGASGRLGPLLARSYVGRLAVSRTAARIFNVNERTESRLLASVPPMLDRVDGWIEAGVLNGESLNAADLEMAPSLALLTYRRDLRDEVLSRPAARLVDRLLPEPPGYPETSLAAGSTSSMRSSG